MRAINYIYHTSNKKYRRPGLESLVSSHRSKTDRTHEMAEKLCLKSKICEKLFKHKPSRTWLKNNT